MFDAATAEYLIFPDFLKAMPAEEGGKRVLYLEASNQARDYQGERVLAKALGESAEYYKAWGNIDLEHLTQIGPIRGIPDYPRYEIGHPDEVKVRDNRVWVKGTIFQGEGPAAACANMFWETLTQLKPPQKWFPSVGGAVLDRGTELDAETQEPTTVIRAVRWTNIGLSKTPVNLTVPSVSTVPFGALAKCWGVGGLNLAKALEAGYATDAAAMTGGQALSVQSLDHGIQSYWDFRDRLAGDLRKQKVKASPEAIIAHAGKEYGISSAEAAEWTERFLSGLKNDLSTKRNK